MRRYASLEWRRTSAAKVLGGGMGEADPPMPAHAGEEESMERNRGETVLARPWGESLAMQ